VTDDAARVVGAPGEPPPGSPSGAAAGAAAPSDAVASGPAGRPTSRGRSLAMTGLIVSSAFLVSRMLGWVRVVVIGYAFHPSQLDAFYTAFRLPDLVFQLVAAGALSSALIPIVAGLVATHRAPRAWRVVSTVANLMLGALLVLAVVLFLAAPSVVRAITPGFDEAKMAQTVELTRIMLLSPVFLALGAIATSVLNAENRFAAAAFAPIVYNLAIIGGAIILGPVMGIEGLAVAVVLGSLGHLLVQLRPLARLGFRYDRRVDLADSEARTALKLMGPRAVGLGATQITFVVVTSLASLLPGHAITAYNVAFTLLQIPMGVIGIPLGVVVFPSLSREVAVGRTAEYVALLTRALRLVLYVMVPAAGLLAILRYPIVRVLFPAFDPALVAATADALLFFLIGLAAHALIAVLARAFYARQDTKTPVYAALLAVVLNTSLAVVLVRPLGLNGLALAIALAAWAEALVLLALLAREVRLLGLGDLGRVALESALATLVAGGVGLLALSAIGAVVGPDPRMVGLVVEGVVAAVAFGLVYLGLSVVLRIPELASIVAVVTDLLRHRRRPLERRGVR